MSFDEIAGSPQEQLSESSGSTATRQFLVAWENRLSFAQAFVGTRYPNFPQARINSIAIAPWNGQDMPPNNVTIVDPSVVTSGYTGKPALITVSYGPDFTKKTWPTDMPKPQYRNGTELRYRISGSAQFLVLPFGGCVWYDNFNPLTDQDNTRILIPIREIEIQWDFVDNPPLSTLDGLMGCVNSGTFMGCEAETLLFENYSVAESFRAAPLNPHTNRVTLQFRRRRIVDGINIHGWNHDYRESPVGWAKVLFKNNYKPRYDLKPFTNMFV